MDDTPLWLYLMIEAKVRKDGDCLGEIGSHLLCDTFMYLVLSTPGSILDPEVRGPEATWFLPNAQSGGALPHFSMEDLLRVVDEHESTGG